MKLKLLKLTMRNFLSYGNANITFDLDQAWTTLILGEDLDNTADGKRSNGVGKTSIINAIAYALYGQPISDISLDNLINNINKKELEVTLDFEVDNTKYQIYRCRKMKSKTDVTLREMKNGADQDVTVAGNINEYVTQKVGMPFELFERIVIFSANKKGFLDLPTRSTSGTNQSDFMEELFGFTILSHKAEAFKKTMKATQTEFERIETQIAGQKAANDKHEQQVASMQNKVNVWETSREQQLQTLYTKLQNLQNIDIEGQKALFEQANEINNQINTINGTLNVATNDIKTLTAEIKTIENGETVQRNKKTTHQKQIKTSEQNLNQLADNKCPFCEQAFKDTTDKIAGCTHEIDHANAQILLIDTELTSLNDSKVELQNLVQQLTGDVAPLKQSVSDLTGQLRTIQSKIVVPNRDQLIQHNSDTIAVLDKIEELKIATNPLMEALDELQGETVEQIDYTTLNEIDKIIDHQKFLLKLLTKKDSFVRKNLLNANIPFLNLQLQQYISDMGLSHRVEFMLDMSVKITQLGRELDQGNLSAGQAARVNFALSVAFRDVKQKLHGTVNMWMLDEILDLGMDSAGVQAAAKILKRIAKQEQIALFVISHREEVEGMFDKTLTIQMKDGFSHVKTQ